MHQTDESKKTRKFPHKLTKRAMFSIMLLIAVIPVLFLIERWFHRPSHTCPPGPKGLPIVGNFFDLPVKYQWKTYAEWKARWGA